MKIKSIAVALLGLSCLIGACNPDDFPLEFNHAAPKEVCVNVHATNPCPDGPDSTTLAD